MFLEGNNGDMEFLVNREKPCFLLSGVLPAPSMQGSSHGFGFTLVDFGFMSHSSVDIVGTTRPCPSSGLALSRALSHPKATELITSLGSPDPAGTRASPNSRPLSQSISQAMTAKEPAAED